MTEIYKFLDIIEDCLDDCVKSATMEDLDHTKCKKNYYEGFVDGYETFRKEMYFRINIKMNEIKRKVDALTCDELDYVIID